MSYNDLPAEPRSAREEFDFSKVPDRGPFTAFMGNLHYETTEATVEKFFGGLNVSGLLIHKVHKFKVRICIKFFH